MVKRHLDSPKLILGDGNSSLTLELQPDILCIDNMKGETTMKGFTEVWMQEWEEYEYDEWPVQRVNGISLHKTREDCAAYCKRELLEFQERTKDYQKRTGDYGYTLHTRPCCQDVENGNPQKVFVEDCVAKKIKGDVLRICQQDLKNFKILKRV